MKLLGKYALALSAVVVTVTVLLAATLLYDFRRVMDQGARFGAEQIAAAVDAQVRSRGLEVTRLLAEQLTNPLYLYDLDRIRRLLRDTRHQSDLRYILVYDEHGRIVHDGSDQVARFGTNMDDAIGLRVANALGPILTDSDDLLDVAVPIFLGERRLGGVRIGFPLDAAQHEVAKLKARIDELTEESRAAEYRSLLQLTLALVLAGIVVAAAVARHLTRPIRALAAMAGRIGAGEREVEVSISRADELGELAGALAAMRDNLRLTTVSRDFLDTIVESLNDGLIVTDSGGAIRMVNHAAGELTGEPAERLIGRSISSLTDDAHICRLLGEKGEFQRRECSLCQGQLPVAVSRSALRGAEGWIYVFQDITERKRHQEHMQLAAGVFESTVEGIFVLDSDGRVRQTNPAFRAILGYESGDHSGMGLAELLSPGEEALLAPVRRALAQEGRWQGELFLRHREGRDLPVWLTLTAVRSDEAQFHAGVFSDLSARKETEERIFHLAYYDHLTGLPNRILFRDRLQQAVNQAERSGHLVALLYLDLDRFKIVNDTRGHAVGDELLKQVAARLGRMLRREDTFARLGGDEFAVISPDLTREDEAAAIARKLIAAFEVPFKLDNFEVFTGTSIGISLYPVDTGDADGLLKNADAAMYKAKESGRSSYQFFTPELNRRVLEHVELEAGLRQALERQEFELHYQAQVDLENGRIVGTEALLRWNRPGQGTISPMRFIPVAEECGLIVPIGEWVLREACRQVAAWMQAGLPPVRVAVNLSPRQFQEPNLLKQVEAALAESGIAPHLLEVEITEGLLMEDLERSIATLIRFNEMGVHISVDDFGTGYSSLSYLKRFPIHTLKIDKTFVRDLAVDQDDAAITRAIITLAHSLGIRVLAEGVETIYQQVYLEEQGCDYAQGYLYSKPVPAADFARLIRDPEEWIARRAEA